MPCILKKPCKNSPGLVIFTHNEYLFGGLKFKSIQQLLKNNKSWRFGVHIQGDCSFLNEWPDSELIDFIMWPNINESFLSNVKFKIIPLSCVYFYPKPILLDAKRFDICIASRAAVQKNFDYSIDLVKEILQKRPHTTVVFLVPDPRELNKINLFAKKNRYFDYSKEIFSLNELKQISFISSSQQSFGLFPITSELYWTLINLSKTLLLTSLVEGTPRCIIESIIHQTMPCVMKNLRSGLKEKLNTYSMIHLDQKNDAEKIIHYLNGPMHYYKSDERLEFLFERNWPQFIDYLNKIIAGNFFSIKDPWIDQNLSNRLAGHLQSGNFQLMTKITMEKFLINLFNGQLNLAEFS